MLRSRRNLQRKAKVNPLNQKAIMKSQALQELDRQYDRAQVNNTRRANIRFNFLNSGKLAANAVSKKQQNFAIMIAADFIYNDHSSRSFNMDDLEAFLQSDRANSHLFWLDCKPDRLGTGASEQREAVEKAIADMKRDQTATVQAEKTIAQLSPAELKRKVSRL